MDSISDNVLEPGALQQPLGSLSVSDGGGGTGAQHPPSHSSLPPPTEPDQLQEALKFAEDVASGKLRLQVDGDPIEFTISRESWFKLQQNFDLWIEPKSSRVAYDSSRSLLTIMPPPGGRLAAVLRFFSDLAHRVKFSLVSSTESKMETTISRESEFKLQQNSQSDLWIEPKSFRVAYDSSRSLFTIMPPHGARHAAVLSFLSDLAHRAKFSLVSSTQSKMEIGLSEYDNDFEGEYESSGKQSDLYIGWYENNYAGQLHTVVEVGVSQSLKSLRALVPLYLQGKPEVQRVVLVKIKETPVLRSPKQPSTGASLTSGPKEFRRDEATGVIWFGDVKVVGETQLLWEVWGRNIDGDPHKTFEETMTYGAVPSRDLPFFTIPEGGTQGDPEVTVGRREMEKFWGVDWVRGSWADARRRAKSLTV